MTAETMGKNAARRKGIENLFNSTLKLASAWSDDDIRK